MPEKLRVALIGAGRFGQNHRRVLAAHPDVTLVGVADPNPATQPTTDDYRTLLGHIDAAVVAATSSAHTEIGSALLAHGVDVLMEKPIAEDLAGGRQLIELAEKHQRVLAIGHLERFNPAVQALAERIQTPLFFEIHRLSMFSPRSLDIDVVLDLMVHDLEILLALTGAPPSEIHAAGISVVTSKVDIANVRLAWPTGCIANLTASRVSTEQVRKLRLFQPHQYYSLDYAKRELFSISVGDNLQPRFEQVPVAQGDPLELEIQDFLDAVRTRRAPRVTGANGLAALDLATKILAKIEEHLAVVSATLAGQPRQIR
jgi:predicted dehydrogenase